MAPVPTVRAKERGLSTTLRLCMSRYEKGTKVLVSSRPLLFCALGTIENKLFAVIAPGYLSLVDDC